MYILLAIRMPPQMRLACDDQSLFSVGEDGTLVCFTVMDKEGRMLKRDKDVTLAEEVLITRSDLEEKVSKISYQKKKICAFNFLHSHNWRKYFNSKKFSYVQCIVL